MQNNNFFDKQRMAAGGMPSYPSMPGGLTPQGFALNNRPRMPSTSVDWPNSSPASPPGHAPMLASQHKMHHQTIVNQQQQHFPQQQQQQQPLPQRHSTLADASNGSIKQFVRPPLPTQQQHPHLQQQQQQQLQQQQQQLQQVLPQAVNQQAQPPGVIIPPNETFKLDNEARRKQLTQYQKRDEIYQKTLNKQHKYYIELAREKKTDIDAFQNDKMQRMHHNPTAVFGKGYMVNQQQRGGNDLRGHIIYPRDRKRRRQTTDFHL